MSSSENTDSIDKSSGKDDVIFVENAMPKKVDKTKIKKKRPYLRDKSGPKLPITGYLRFISKRRAEFCSQNPNLSFTGITKILATEWNQLPADKKQPYLLAAEQDRVKYDEELAAYKKTDAYKNFIKIKLNKKKLYTSIQKDQKFKKEKSSTNKFKKDQEFIKAKPSTDNKLKKDQEFTKAKPSTDNKLKKDQEFIKAKPSTDNKLKKDQEFTKAKPSTDNKLKKDQELKKENTSSKNNNEAHDIPIFTEEFLDFNKARETELRNIRKNVTTQEQEVCVLDKHIERVKNGTAKLKAYNEKLEAGCTKYEEYLKELRSKLLDAFANFEFTDNTESPTNETIDEFMVNLSTNLTNSSDADSSRIANVKKAISKLNSSQC